METITINNKQYPVENLFGTKVLIDDNFNMYYELKKSSKIVITYFYNKFPIKFFSGNFTKIHSSWLTGGDKNSFNAFFFSDDNNGENIIGSFLLEPTEKLNKVYLLNNDDFSAKLLREQGITHTLFIVPKDKISSYVY